MRLNSISFTHASTALFGLAVTGYAAIRMAGYDVPHPSGHVALPAPPVVHRAPDPEQSADRSKQQSAGVVDHGTRDRNDGPPVRAASRTQHHIARLEDSTTTPLSWSRDTQEWRHDPPSQEATDQGWQKDASSDDAVVSDTSQSRTSADTTPGDAWPTTHHEVAPDSNDDD